MATKLKQVAATSITKLQIGTVDVESGQVMIVDPCYARSEENHIDKESGLQHGPGKVDYDKVMEFCYQPDMLDKTCKVCRKSVREARNLNEAFRINALRPQTHELTHDQRRQIGFGTVSTTGVGDGTFPVYAIMEDGVLAGLEVRFID